MGWKEFLKLTKGKMIVYFILLLGGVSFLFNWIEGVTGYPTIINYSVTEIIQTIKVILGTIGTIFNFPAVLLLFIVSISIETISLFVIIYLIILIIETYLLSSFYFWIYNKVRKKK